MPTMPAYLARCYGALHLPQSSVEMKISTVICHQKRHGSPSTVNNSCRGLVLAASSRSLAMYSCLKQCNLVSSCVL